MHAKMPAKMPAKMRSPREREARETLEGLRGFHQGDPEGRWRAILSGLTSSYRWSRETMAAAYGGCSDAAFHQWRLAVRDHALQVRALAALWPAALGGRLEVLERLAELQGQDRDLHLRHGERPEMLDPINQRHEALHALARPLGRRLFGAPPRSSGAACRPAGGPGERGRSSPPPSSRPARRGSLNVGCGVGLNVGGVGCLKRPSRQGPAVGCKLDTR